MTEKEKMLSGKLYNAMDPELFRNRLRAKKICYKINKTKPHQAKRRIRMIKSLINPGDFCYIEPPFFCDYGYNITVGNNFYANHNCMFLDVNKVIIGDYVMLGPYVQIYTATHTLDAKTRREGLELGYPIEIGDNVWIGGGVIICPNVKIGSNAVIGAGSIVTKDIPDNVLAVGNPCKVVKIV